MDLGFRFGKCLKNNSVVCFYGDLAAGKTTFIKGLTKAMHEGIDSSQVNSPTFAYLNIYEGAKTVYHFDLYRLRDTDEFLSMGFDEFFFANGICCIEWSERISSLLPQDYLQVKMEHVSEEQRRITILPGIFDLL